MRVSRPAELEAFLDRRGPIGSDATFKPGDLIGEWRITALIGKGGSGEVYRVEHVSLGTVAAIKVLMKASETEHFRREARILSGIEAGCFPRLYSFGEAGGHLYYVIELLEPAPLPKGDSEIAARRVLCQPDVMRMPRSSSVRSNVAIYPGGQDG